MTKTNYRPAMFCAHKIGDLAGRGIGSGGHGGRWGGGGDGGELRPGGEGGEAVAAIACRDSGVALTLIPARGDVAVVATTCAAAATQINRPSPHRPAPRPQHSKLEHLSREKIAMLLPHSHCFASLKGSRSSHM